MPSERPVLREQVKEVVIERIINGQYAPGDRVVESHLAAEFGVSQAPVREALRDLEAMRFVEYEPYRGSRVRRVTEEELAEIYPVRAALEELAGATAAGRMTGDVLAQLGQELAAMRDAAHGGDRRRLLVHDARFHEIIVEAAGNQTLLDMWTGLRIHARTLVSLLRGEEDLVAVAETHTAILDALRAGDPAAAGCQMRRHIESFGALFTPTAARQTAAAPGAGEAVVGDVGGGQR